MVLFLNIIFWFCVGLLLHSYIFYSIIVRVKAKGKVLNTVRYTDKDDWPVVSILMAAYNEELVLNNKLESIIALAYPIDKIKVYIGSDNSSDNTNEILQTFSEQYDFIKPTYFDTRQGKPSIINQLAVQAKNARPDQNHIFLLTDASVMLSPEILTNLVRHFKNPQIGLVDAHMTYVGMQAAGISISENTYLNQEVQLKQAQSIANGKMIGPFGGCFAIRAELYTPVPSNYLVDDFYLAMDILSKDYLAINDLEAYCYEPVSHASSEEFRRKKRISTGNFQNLFHFRSILNPFTSLGFAFISHKVLRWLGPFLMILILISSVLLAYKGSAFFTLVVAAQLLWYLAIPLVDIVLSKLGVQLFILRNISYFIQMNFALLLGFFAAASGVKSGTWEPTSRDL